MGVAFQFKVQKIFPEGQSIWVHILALPLTVLGVGSQETNLTSPVSASSSIKWDNNIFTRVGLPWWSSG